MHSWQILLSSAQIPRTRKSKYRGKLWALLIRHRTITLHKRDKMAIVLRHARIAAHTKKRAFRDPLALCQILKMGLLLCRHVKLLANLRFRTNFKQWPCNKPIHAGFLALKVTLKSTQIKQAHHSKPQFYLKSRYRQFSRYNYRNYVIITWQFRYFCRIRHLNLLVVQKERTGQAPVPPPLLTLKSKTR